MKLHFSLAVPYMSHHDCFLCLFSAAQKACGFATGHCAAGALRAVISRADVIANNIAIALLNAPGRDAYLDVG